MLRSTLSLDQHAHIEYYRLRYCEYTNNNIYLELEMVWHDNIPPDWARVKMGSFFAISTRICFCASSLSSISYLCLSEYDSWNWSNKQAPASKSHSLRIKNYKIVAKPVRIPFYTAMQGEWIWTSSRSRRTSQNRREILEDMPLKSGEK